VTTRLDRRGQVPSSIRDPGRAVHAEDDPAAHGIAPPERPCARARTIGRASPSPARGASDLPCSPEDGDLGQEWRSSGLVAPERLEVGPSSGRAPPDRGRRRGRGRPTARSHFPSPSFGRGRTSGHRGSAPGRTAPGAFQARGGVPLRRSSTPPSARFWTSWISSPRRRLRGRSFEGPTARYRSRRGIAAPRSTPWSRKTPVFPARGGGRGLVGTKARREWSACPCRPLVARRRRILRGDAGLGAHGSSPSMKPPGGTPFAPSHHSSVVVPETTSRRRGVE